MSTLRVGGGGRGRDEVSSVVKGQGVENGEVRTPYCRGYRRPGPTELYGTIKKTGVETFVVEEI